MARYEITGCATDVFTLAEIQQALRDVGAERVNARYAFGWRNQPRVATFAADNLAMAKFIADNARNLLRPGSLPSLLPTEYAE